MTPELEQFLRGEMDPARFTHRDHVRMGYELLKRQSFVEAAWRYSNALRAMTARAGQPGRFHQTVTVAFLSLIAEAMAGGDTGHFEVFAQAHPELLHPAVLARWYAPERLGSALARQTFLLP